MKTMTRALTGLAALGTVVVAAFDVPSAIAADLGGPRYGGSIKDDPYVPPPFQWTGFYIGAHAGWARNDATTSYTGGATVSNLVAAGALPGSQDVGHNSFTGGAQLGYNFQIGGLVLGAEADISSLDGGKSSSTSNVTTSLIPIAGTGFLFAVGNRFNSSASLDMDWVSTLRGRIGLASDRWLLFATGGVAWSDIKLAGSMTRQFPAGGPVLDAWSGTSSDHLGYVLGGGVEYALTNNWIVKLEGLFYNFGRTNDSLTQTLICGALCANATAFPVTRTTEIEVTVIRAGINYKF